MSESGDQDFGDHLKQFGKTMLRLLGQTAIQEGAKIEAVQKEVEAQKLVLSKELLWKIFPFLAIGGLSLFLVRKVQIK